MKKKKVIVAMSGGVDSSLAAALIKSQGYDTMGITLKLSPGAGKGGSFGEKSRKGIEDARTVARKLDISHRVFDVRREFEEEVIERFCREYLSCRTPNPCILCNESIKFGTLLSHARTQGADCIATGHYARVVYDANKGRFLLKKGKDLQKDQSYFLCLLNQEQLRSVMLPLGEFTKSEVREKAQGLGLTVSAKPESQEICFIPDNDYVAFIKSRYAECQRPGPIVSTSGEVLGEHKGIFSFTIGQRKGLNIAQGYPLYVVSLDKDTNGVVVGRKEEAFRQSLTASRMNWVAMESLSAPMALKARIRYRHSENAARVVPLSPDQVKVEFNQPQLAITPGQAVVLYDGDIVVGGGWID
jgi:tRNA-specific 2-thiouridylase